MHIPPPPRRLLLILVAVFFTGMMVRGGTNEALHWTLSWRAMGW
jgi:hypothetical protein